MGKNPAFLFYPNDWSRDLEEHPLEIEGAWIRICCKLWWAEPRGTLTRTLDQWAKILRVDVPTAERVLKYMQQWHIANVTEALPKRYQVTASNDESNGEITVESRRMLRDEKDRDLNVLRQRRFKEKRKSNAEVTPSVTEKSQRSSVPVPVSVTNTKKEKEKNKEKNIVVLPDFLSPDLWQEFKKHRIAIKKRMTPQAEKLAIKTLTALRDQGQDHTAIIEQSILRGWSGLFPLRPDDNATQKDPGKEAERIKQELITKGEWY